MTEPTEVADRIIALAADGLRGLEMTISAWPNEFRAIIWEAVAKIATDRADEARGFPVQQGLADGQEEDLTRRGT